MTNIVKSALIFVGGAAVGGAVGWFITKKQYDEIMDERIEAEVEATREFYKTLINQTDENEVESEANDIPKTNPISDYTVAIDEAIHGPEIVSVTESYTDRMNRRKEDLLRPERVRYETFSKPDKNEEKEVDEVLLRQNDDDPRTDIYVINAEQFAHERHGFDKVTLYWWELERILSEEDMDILDVPDLLGSNWEAHIGEEEKDIVYVRNENLETDYEVVVQHESFYAMRD